MGTGPSQDPLTAAMERPYVEGTPEGAVRAAMPEPRLGAGPVLRLPRPYLNLKPHIFQDPLTAAMERADAARQHADDVRKGPPNMAHIRQSMPDYAHIKQSMPDYGLGSGLGF